MSTPRPESSAILGVSMPLALKQRIKALADADKRTMASWCAIHLEQVVYELENPKPSDPTTSTHPTPAPRVESRSRLKFQKANARHDRQT